jgi:hypothetical protein
LVSAAAEVAVLGNDATIDGSFVSFEKVDGDPDVRVLLGFDDLLGTGEGRLDPAVEVLKAWLVIHTGPLAGDSCVGPVVVQPMAVDWSVQSFYSDFGGDGPDEDQGEAGGVVGEFFGMGLETECRVDVTELVRSWQQGSPNEGLMLRALTDDSWWIRMPGGDPALAPSLVMVTVQAAGGYAAYVEGLGFPGLDPADDGDGDGLPALVEYGLGLNPGEFNRSPGLIRDAEGLKLDFPRGAAARSDGGLRFEIESSGDLVEWEAAEGVVESEDGIGLSVSPDNRRFFRLVVTELEN